MVDHLLDRPDLLRRCARLELVVGSIFTEKATDCFARGDVISKVSQQCTHLVVLGVSHALGIDENFSGFFKKGNRILQLLEFFCVVVSDFCAKGMMIGDEVGELLIGSTATNGIWIEVILRIFESELKFRVQTRGNQCKRITQSVDSLRRRILSLRESTESARKSSGGTEIGC